MVITNVPIDGFNIGKLSLYVYFEKTKSMVKMVDVFILFMQFNKKIQNYVLVSNIILKETISLLMIKLTFFLVFNIPLSVYEH